LLTDIGRGEDEAKADGRRQTTDDGHDIEGQDGIEGGGEKWRRSVSIMLVVVENMDKWISG
jgi:hypothetical protein